jgi:hypothetical protein
MWIIKWEATPQNQAEEWPNLAAPQNNLGAYVFLYLGMQIHSAARKAKKKRDTMNI